MHRMGSACDSCKKELDEKTIVDFDGIYLKNKNQEEWIKKIKIEEGYNY